MQLTVPMLLVDTWLLAASMRRLMPKSQILHVNPAHDRTPIHSQVQQEAALIGQRLQAVLACI
jgi:hypothetical protein